MVVEEASLHGLPEWKSYVVILFDEMKVRESLVYDKHTAQVIGFNKLGDLNDQLDELEGSDVDHPTVATHILGIMDEVYLVICGSHTLTSQLLKPLVPVLWEAIERLERLGFKVVALTADGASPNRKIFSMHSCSSSDICYKTPNPYTEENRYIYFFSDVPQPLKTTRNCWSHSFSHNNTRKLWVRTYINIVKD